MPAASKEALNRSFALALAQDDFKWARKLLAQGVDLDEAALSVVDSSSDPNRAMRSLEALGAVWGPDDYLRRYTFRGDLNGSHALARSDAIVALLDRGVTPPNRALELAAHGLTPMALFNRLVAATPARPQGAVANACRFFEPAKVKEMIRLGWDFEAPFRGKTPLEWCFSEDAGRSPGADECASLIAARLPRAATRPIQRQRDGGSLGVSASGSPSETSLAKAAIRFNMEKTASVLFEKWRSAAPESDAGLARAALLKAGKKFPLLVEREELFMQVPLAPRKRASSL